MYLVVDENLLRWAPGSTKLSARSYYIPPSPNYFHGLLSPDPLPPESSNSHTTSSFPNVLSAKSMFNYMSNVKSKSKTPLRLTANTKSRVARRENVERTSFMKQRQAAQLDANMQREDKAQRERLRVIQDIYVQQKFDRARRGRRHLTHVATTRKTSATKQQPVVQPKEGYPDCNPSVERTAAVSKGVNLGCQQESAGSKPKMMSARARKKDSICNRTEGAGVAVLMFVAAIVALHNATQ